jgi:hypothetical protein
MRDYGFFPGYDEDQESNNLFSGFGRNRNRMPPRTKFQDSGASSTIKPSSPMLPKDEIRGPFDDQNESTGPLTRKYRDVLNEEPPISDEYKPSKARRIGAVLAGVGFGPAAGFEFLNRPLRKKQTDRANRVEELNEGAKLEFDQGKEAWDRNIQTRTANIAQQNADSLTANRESLAQRRTAMTAIQNFRANNPGYDIKFGKGGNFVAINRLDPSKIIDTGISSGTLTEEDKADIEQNNAIARIEATGAQARQTENVRQDNREVQADLEQKFKLQLEDLKRSKKSYGVLLPKGGKVTFYNKEDPTDIQVSDVDTGTLTDEQRAELNDFTTFSTTSITKTDEKGNPAEITRSTTRTRPTRPNTNAPKPNTPNGGRSDKVLMLAPDGITQGYVDKDKVEEAKKKGYKLK